MINLLSLEAQANIAEIIQENEEVLSNDALEEAIKQCDKIFPLNHPVKIPGNLVYLSKDLQNFNGASNALLQLTFSQMENTIDPRKSPNKRGRKSFQDFKFSKRAESGGVKNNKHEQDKSQSEIIKIKSIQK